MDRQTGNRPLPKWSIITKMFIADQQTPFGLTLGQIALDQIQDARLVRIVQTTPADCFPRKVNRVDWILDKNSLAPYSMCDVTDFLTCNKVVTHPTNKYVGPIGICDKGSSKSESACGTNVKQLSPSTAGVLYYDYTVCSSTHGYYCDLLVDTVNVSSGFCRKKGSLPPGKNTSNGAYCQSGLIYDNIAPVAPCKTYAQMNINCSKWTDCANDVNPTGYQATIGDYVGGGAYPFAAYSWSVTEYFYSQVACVANRCQFTGPNCQYAYMGAVDYDKQTFEYPSTCKFVKCQLKEQIANGYTICTDVNSSIIFSPSVFMFLITVIAMLFNVPFGGLGLFF